MDVTLLAETWECSTHPDGPCHVVSGVFVCRMLADVLKEHPEFLGVHCRGCDDMSILIKLIDAKENLSV